MTTRSDPPLLKEVPEDLLEPWAEYLTGHWFRGVPEQPGLYPLATLEGDFVGYREFVQKGGKVIDPTRGYKEPGWVGWIWSCPLPLPPKKASDVL